MTDELRTALIGCHHAGGWLGGYCDQRTPGAYVLTLWTGSIRHHRFTLDWWEYAAAYRVWQWLKKPSKRKPYRRRAA